MLNDDKLIELEKKYYDIICGILEKNLGKILTEVNSQKRFTNLSTTSKRNPIESKAENTIENIISNQLNWDVCSLPISSDSCYSCGDAIVHIDVKTTLNTDIDAPSNMNRVNVEASQISYIYDNELIIETPYSGRGKKPKPAKWNAKLKCYESHEDFGEIPNLTYFVRIIYSENNLLEELYFLSVPNGQLSDLFYRENILQGGKQKKNNGNEWSNIRVMPEKISHIQPWRNKLIYKRH